MSGIRKLVRTPPMSMASADSRGKPLTSMPKSDDVPPTSTTRPSGARTGRLRRASSWPGRSRSSAPGYRARPRPHQRAVVLREEQPRVEALGGDRLGTPPAAPASTAVSAAFRTVAFSRSRGRASRSRGRARRSRPAPGSRGEVAAVSSSCSGSAGENAPEIATASAVPATASKNRLAASRSSGEISRPSTSWPPPITSPPARTASRSSAGQPNSGRTAKRSARRGAAPRPSAGAALEDRVHRVGRSRASRA